MRERLQRDHMTVARVVVWAALSLGLLYWLRWGSLSVSITSYYKIRRTVPHIWGTFADDLPSVGSAWALTLVYWSCIVVMIVGVLAMLWLALESDPEVAAASDNQSPLE